MTKRKKIKHFKAPPSTVKTGNFNITTKSPDETIELGNKIGKALKGGEIICLMGALGTGKTHLIKGITAGLGINNSEQVNSPTYVLVNEYYSPDACIKIYHIDAYRIESIEEFEMLGFDEFCEPDSVVLIEWADRVKTALKDLDAIQIKLKHIERKKRHIQIINTPKYILDFLNE